MKQWESTIITEWWVAALELVLSKLQEVTPNVGGSNGVNPDCTLCTVHICTHWRPRRRPESGSGRSTPRTNVQPSIEWVMGTVNNLGSKLSGVRKLSQGDW
eukprot:4081187-Ditylum_brightwellii.AAC.1